MPNRKICEFVSDHVTLGIAYPGWLTTALNVKSYLSEQAELMVVHQKVRASMQKHCKLKWAQFLLRSQQRSVNLCWTCVKVMAWYLLSKSLIPCGLWCQWHCITPWTLGQVIACWCQTRNFLTQYCLFINVICTTSHTWIQNSQKCHKGNHDRTLICWVRSNILLTCRNSVIYPNSRWRNSTETLPVLLALCEGNPPVTSNSPPKVQWSDSLVVSLCTHASTVEQTVELPVIWGALMSSRIISYHLGTVYISLSAASAWHSLSPALCPLQSTLFQIMHFAGSTLVDFLCSVDDFLANLAFLEGAAGVICYSVFNKI